MTAISQSPGTNDHKPGDGSGAEPCLIIGGGISGLSLAAWLSRDGVPVRVLDKGGRPGGVIRTVRKDGFLFEGGPNTILDKSPAFDELVNLAGLENEIIRVPLNSQKRYIWHGKRLNPVPAGPADLLFGRLFDFGSKVRLMREPWVPPVDKDEKLRDFIIRRLGKSVYERAFVPMVQGIGAGDPATMSTAYSFPVLKELEKAHGSLIKGFMHKMKAGRNGSGPRRTTNLISFPDGLQRLPLALAERLGENFIPHIEVKQIRPLFGAPGYNVTAQRTRSGRKGPAVYSADRIILCAEAFNVADWIARIEPQLAERLKSIHYAPLTTVSLGVKASSLQLPAGFGFLVARNQRMRILGAIFNSNFLPARAPEGCVALTVMVGGDLDPLGAALEDDSLIELIRRDLKVALKWDGEIESVHIERWRRAIPQYGMDHGEVLDAVADVERRRPGLMFFGNWLAGVSINDRIEHAQKAAQKISAQIHSGEIESGSHAN